MDVANLIFFFFIGATSLITSVCISMRFIKKCNSLICSCEQDTTHSATAQTNSNNITPRSLLQMASSKFTTKAAQPVALWGLEDAKSNAGVIKELWRPVGSAPIVDAQSSSQPSASKPESQQVAKQEVGE